MELFLRTSVRKRKDKDFIYGLVTTSCLSLVKVCPLPLER